MAKRIRRKGVIDTRALDVSIDEEGNVVDQGNMPEQSQVINLPEMPEPLSEPPKYEAPEPGLTGENDLLKFVKDVKEGASEQPESKLPTANLPEIILPKSESKEETKEKSKTWKPNQYASESASSKSGPQAGPQTDTKQKKDFYDQTVGRAEKWLGIDETRKYAGASVRTTDRLAALGGYSKKSYNTLVDEKREIKEDYDKAKADFDELKAQIDYHNMRIRDWNDFDTSRYEELNRKRRDKSITTDEESELANISRDVERKRLDAKESRDFLNSQDVRYKLQRLRNDKFETESKLKELNKEFTRYDIALAKGAEIDKEKHNWRNEWARPIAENTSNMLTRPVIGNVTDVVGYGGMTGKTATAGLNELVGGYKTSSGANEWTRTRVGDRQLVEALVSVKPSSMITPFGAPGTVGGSSLTSQFEYNTPLRRIGVGDVTARPGYRINIEDIHRKKKVNSSPQLTRRKLIIRKKIMKKRSQVNPGMSSLLNAMSKIEKIKMPGNKTTLTYVNTMKGVGKSGILMIKGTSLNIKGTGAKKVVSETKPMSINLGNVNVVTPKIVELNLNKQSVSSKKRKLVKI